VVYLWHSFACSNRISSFFFFSHFPHQNSLYFVCKVTLALYSGASEPDTHEVVKDEFRRIENYVECKHNNDVGHWVALSIIIAFEVKTKPVTHSFLFSFFLLGDG